MMKFLDPSVPRLDQFFFHPIDPFVHIDISHCQKLLGYKKQLNYKCNNNNNNKSYTTTSQASQPASQRVPLPSFSCFTHVVVVGYIHPCMYEYRELK